MTQYKQNLKQAFILNCIELLKNLQLKHADFSKINIKDYNLSPLIFRAMRTLGFLEITGATKNRLYKYVSSIREEKYKNYDDEQLSSIIYNTVESEKNIAQVNKSLKERNIKISPNVKLIPLERINKDAEQKTELIFKCLNVLHKELTRNPNVINSLTREDLIFSVDLTCEENNSKLFGEVIVDSIIKNKFLVPIGNFSGPINTNDFPWYYELNEKNTYNEAFLKSESLKIYNCTKEQTNSKYNKIFSLLKYLSTIKEFTSMKMNDVFKKYNLTTNDQTVIANYCMTSRKGENHVKEYKWKLTNIYIAELAKELHYNSNKYSKSYSKTRKKSKRIAKDKINKIKIAPVGINPAASKREMENINDDSKRFIEVLSKFKEFTPISISKLAVLHGVKVKNTITAITNACLEKRTHGESGLPKAYKWKLGEFSEETLQFISKEITNYSRRFSKPKIKVFKPKVVKSPIEKVDMENLNDNAKNFIRELSLLKEFSPISIKKLAEKFGVKVSNSVTAITNTCLEKKLTGSPYPKNHHSYKWKLGEITEDIFKFVSAEIRNYSRRFYKDKKIISEVEITKPETNISVKPEMRPTNIVWIDSNKIDSSTKINDIDIMLNELHIKLKNKENEIAKSLKEAEQFRTLIKEGEAAKIWQDKMKKLS